MIFVFARIANRADARDLLSEQGVQLSGIDHGGLPDYQFDLTG
jgi:hypothetical protein